MSIEIKRPEVVQIFLHLCFIVGVIFFFRYNSLLRPATLGALYKEYISALFMLIMIYVNYFYIIPHYFLKRDYLVFLLLSLVSILLASFLEMTLVTPYIKASLPSSFNEQDIRISIIMHFLFISGRNTAFFLFFFMLKVLENEIQCREKEQITLAQSKGYISVPTRDSIKYISLSEIFYIIHEKNYCYIHTQNGNNYSKYISLMKMNGYLPENLFIRINRNIIINKNNIVSCTKEEVTIYSDYSGEEKIFSLSEKYVPNMREKIASAGGLNHLYGGLKDRFGGLNESIDMANLEKFMDNIAHDEDLLNLCRIIAKDPSVTTKSLSEQSHIPLRTIERKIKYLKDNGVLQHNGAKKNGGYAFSPSVSPTVLNWLTGEHNN